jgi:hypothetical protein
LTRRDLDLGVIRLELPVESLHGIVHRNLHERHVDDANGTRSSHRRRLNRNFIPVDDGIRGRRRNSP